MKKKYPLMKAARFFAAAVFAVLVLAACEQPAGTLDGGRDIGAVELRKIGLDPAYPLDGAYTLRENVTLSGWTPIGTFTAPFTGTLDGRGRTITLSGARGGLFAFTRGAVIRNLSVRAAISAEGRAHNAAAGSVVNTMLPGTRIVSCEGSGSVALTSNPAEGLMVYAGGLVGYAGDGSSDGSAPSGCVIENSGWSGTVTVTGGYPYAGGVIGYNYSQSVVRRCSSAGTVTSRGSTLPYAGGVAGYNSRESLIEDCYSTAEVQAVSESKAALAGGVAGADAAGSTIRRCYAAGGVSAAVDGGGSGSLGGSLGVRIAANAGGIAGSMYYNAGNGAGNLVENCVALNPRVGGVDNGAGAIFAVYRVAGDGTEGAMTRTNNHAFSGMVLGNGSGGAGDKTAAGRDGADRGAMPDEAFYAGLGWDFAAIWRMTGGYPRLRWE